MVELRLVGLSEDRRRLIFSAPTGQEFTVAVDDRLRAALRGDRARLGQLEIQMDSALRPRDIQARIRAGESPESVAEVAQVHVDKIMGYAVPVLAERQHMAERAQRSGLRRKGGDGPGRLLGEAVAQHLRSHNVDPETASWDAWRREDGKWTVTVGHTAGGREQTGTFIFDALGRYAVADDDDARRLLGEAEPEPEKAAPRRERPARRLSAVADTRENDSLPFGDSDQPADDLTAVANAVRDEEGDPAAATDEQPAEPDTESEPDPETEDAEPEPDVAAEEPKRKGRKSRGRASVPSWDEIMFGRTKE